MHSLLKGKKKVELEIEASRRMMQRGIHPLDVLDDYIHAIMVLQLSKAKKENPSATRQELIGILKKNVKYCTKLIKKRKIRH